MPVSAAVGAFAIVPSNDLPAAIAFWERLGFARAGGDARYIILRGWDCEVHVTQAGDGPGVFRKSTIRSASSFVRPGWPRSPLASMT